MNQTMPGEDDADEKNAPGKVENKLDEDFLFYLSFTKTFYGNLTEKSDIEMCQAWLQKLCGTSVKGVDAKRCRNVYLLHLVLAMQEGRLSAPFVKSPPDGQLPPICCVFGPDQPEIKEPPWLEEVVEADGGDFSHSSTDGRCYLATRALEDGRGLFGYLAVSVAEEKPLWMNDHGDAGEGAQGEDERLNESYRPTWQHTGSAHSGEMQSTNMHMTKQRLADCPHAEEPSLPPSITDALLTGNSMWQEATEQKPKLKHLRALQELYPPELIERFVELLNKERQKILHKHQKLNDTIMTEMEKDLNEELQVALDKYKLARNAWLKASKALKEIQSAKKAALPNTDDEEVEYRQQQDHARITRKLEAELAETQAQYEEASKRGLDIQAAIEAERKRIKDTVKMSDQSKKRLTADNDAIRFEITQIKDDITNQEMKIKELQNMLAMSQRSLPCECN